MSVREFRRLPDTDQTMTLEDWANWILALPDEYKKKQIWFVDISYPYKDKPLNLEMSPTGTHVSIEDDYS